MLLSSFIFIQLQNCVTAKKQAAQKKLPHFSLHLNLVNLSLLRKVRTRDYRSQKVPNHHHYYQVLFVFLMCRCGRDVPTLLRALPVDGDTWRRRGSMNGVKEEDDLCFCMLLLDWLYGEAKKG